MEPHKDFRYEYHRRPLPRGGNFWAHPNGSGFSQTCVDSNSDGICDSPYTLDSNNIDYLPLAFNASPSGDTIGIYDSNTGFFFLKNNNTPGAADKVFQFGAGGNNIKPLVGDWNGDGIDTIGIYDINTGFFFVKNNNTPGPADTLFQFGAGGSSIKPLVGDWDGQ